jgi:histidinol-phosphate aminotransferase
VNKVRLPFNVNALSQAVAVEALKKKKVLKAAIREIAGERDKILAAMERIKGVTPFPSEANFILFRVKDPHKIYGRLLEKGILVRNISDAVTGCLRVTVGTPKENVLFLRALEKAV